MFLELVNLYCAAAIRNCEFFEIIDPIEYFYFGLAYPIRIKNGHDYLSEKPELGIELYRKKLNKLKALLSEYIKEGRSTK